MLSLMRVNKILGVDKQNLTITAQPGALLTEITDTAAADGLFIRLIWGKELHQ